LIYAVGNFTTIGGESISYVGAWNGTAWTGLGEVASAHITAANISPDKELYVVGTFTSIGGLDYANGIAKWNGSSWSHIDFQPPAGGTASAVSFVALDPVVVSNFDTWIGMSGPGNAYVSDLTTVTNDGSVHAFPRIIFERSGGTEATILLLRNNTSGGILNLSYSLLDGETLTIDLRPTKKSIISSFFGSKMEAVFANSDLGQFTLLPGDNVISCFVYETGAPTVYATILWQDTYDGLD